MMPDFVSQRINIIDGQIRMQSFVVIMPRRSETRLYIYGGGFSL
ncbi:hypothetical protein FOCG_18103 [Fusarium oxysporum f. sp. radicis-lycopersici 26381]|nr:hypothetical protein FOCG_18103 [Fusarium oxysporum f. sp. radicis-lycopersici 26381]